MDQTHGASSAGPRTPTNDETSTAGTVRGLRDQENTARSEYEAAGDDPATTSPKTRENATLRAVGTAEADCKFFATLQARAALAGVALSRTEDDCGREVFIASKWALTKELASLAEVEELLVRIGGQHGPKP